MDIQSRGQQTLKKTNPQSSKTILRKFTQSEKSSLNDLSRQSPNMERHDPLDTHSADYGANSRSSHDVSFAPYNNSGRHAFHNRSTSGTSQFSSTSSGPHRAGSFVHPFQQTPRPYTPPLAAATALSDYQSSLMDSDYSRDSPALTEDEDYARYGLRSPSILSNRTNPSAASQPHRLRTKSSAARMAQVHPQPNLLSPATLRSSDNGSSMNPASALRSSFDKGYRVRSRTLGSDIAPLTRADEIREARRKFEEREQAKDDKRAREEVKAKEKREEKQARKSNKSSEGTRSKRSKSDVTEKAPEFHSQDYRSAAIQAPPQTSDFAPAPRARTGTSTTKKKTQSAWASFMMWLRTRLLRMSKKTPSRR